MLYHDFPLKCFLELKEFTLNYMDQFCEHTLYVKEIALPQVLIETFNKEMAEYNLPGAWNFLAFKRKNFYTESTNVHVDYSSSVNSVVYSSIIVPIEGCEDTVMYWMYGEYTTNMVSISSNTTYAHILWNNTPSLLEKVEISDRPVLTKVDVPHSVTSRKDGSYRTILSIRLLNNPKFEEIIKTRFG